MGWLDCLSVWEAKAKARVEWISDFGRGSENVAEHTMVPVLFFSLHVVPREDDQIHLRGAAGDSQAAALGAETAVKHWIDAQNETQDYITKLESFHCTVDCEGTGLHNRYVARNISYVCRFERLVVAECAGQGRSKSKAKNHAAQKLIEAGKYCMLDLSKSR